MHKPVKEKLRQRKGVSIRESCPQSSYLSQISQIIFVEKKLSCGEILGNFGEILGNFGKFWEVLGDFATIYALSCGEKLSPKSTFVEKKWQIWGLKHGSSKSTVSQLRSAEQNVPEQSKSAEHTTGRGVGAAEKVSICMWACGHVWGQASLFHLYKFLYICREGSSLSWLGRQAALPGNSGTDLERKLNAEKLPRWGFWLFIYTTIFRLSLLSPLISES